VNKLDKSKKYIVHCRSGYRARIAYSFLKALDYDVKVSLIEAEKISKLRKP
jgi:rhodanese-related sulfurtransferase